MFASVYTSFIRMNKSAYRINRIILLIKRRLQLIKYFKWDITIGLKYTQYSTIIIQSWNKQTDNILIGYLDFFSAS